MRKHGRAQERCDSLGSTVGGVPERHSLGRVELIRNPLHLIIISHSESMRARATKRSVDWRGRVGVDQRLAMRNQKTTMVILYFVLW